MLSSRPQSTGTTQDRCEHEPALSLLTLQAAEQDVVVVVGEADLATAPVLHDRLVQALADRRRPVVVELGALTFCDLHGLDALQAAARAAETAGVRLVFRGASPQVRWLQRTFPGRSAAVSRPRVPRRPAGSAGRAVLSTSLPDRARVPGTPGPGTP